jgi:hypothetical protein
VKIVAEIDWDDASMGQGVSRTGSNQQDLGTGLEQILHPNVRNSPCLHGALGLWVPKTVSQ